MTSQSVEDQIKYWVELEQRITMMPVKIGDKCKLPACKNLLGTCDSRWCNEHIEFANAYRDELKEKRQRMIREEYKKWTRTQAMGFVNSWGQNREIARIVFDELKNLHKFE